MLGGNTVYILCWTWIHNLCNISYVTNWTNLNALEWKWMNMNGHERSRKNRDFDLSWTVCEIYEKLFHIIFFINYSWWYKLDGEYYSKIFTDNVQTQVFCFQKQPYFNSVNSSIIGPSIIRNTLKVEIIQTIGQFCSNMGN